MLRTSESCLLKAEAMIFIAGNIELISIIKFQLHIRSYHFNHYAHHEINFSGNINDPCSMAYSARYKTYKNIKI